MRIGGIHNYLAEFANEGGGHWIGKNYTFDKRFAHGANAAELEQHTGHDVVVGKCSGCGCPWDKYRGKKRCPVPCGVPLLLCNDCLASDAVALCTLCQEDKVKGHAQFNKRKHYNEVALQQTKCQIEKSHLSSSMLATKKLAVHACGVCDHVFTSRNGLFRHIKETGHANRKAKKQKQHPNRAKRVS